MQMYALFWHVPLRRMDTSLHQQSFEIDMYWGIFVSFFCSKFIEGSVNKINLHTQKRTPQPIFSQIRMSITYIYCSKVMISHISNNPLQVI